MRIFLSITISLAFFSCSKNSSMQKDTEPPVITLISPVNGQTYISGQAIQIKGTISDNLYIAEVHTHLSNKNTGALLMDVHLFPGSSSTIFSQSATATGGINYKVQVIARDRAANETIISAEFSCN